MEKIKQPILITGVERSGSSIISRVINIAGAFVGKTNHMVENRRIKSLVDEYYQTAGKDINGQYPLPDVSKLSIPVDWRDRILEALKADGWDGGSPWMYKGSRVAQIWPVWNYAFPGAKWVIVRRRTGDIVQSCLKTAYMKAFKLSENQAAIDVQTESDGWKWWVREHESRFVEIITQGLDCKVVWPERLVEGDYSQIYEMLRFLGLPWKDEIIAKIDPMLYKTRKKQKSWQEQL